MNKKRSSTKLADVIISLKDDRGDTTQDWV